MKRVARFQKCPARFAAVLIAILAVGLLVPAASAHPLGNFTINHYARLELAPNEVRVRFVLDYAEIPTFQERQTMEANSDGSISADAQAKYLSAKIEELRAHLNLTLDGTAKPLALVLNSAEMQLAPGQGGLPVMRVAAWFVAPIAPSAAQPANLMFRDDTYADRIGWREIVVRPATFISLIQSDVSTEDASDELRSYPQNLLAQPLNEREAQITFALGASSQAPAFALAPSSSGIGAVDLTKDAFAALITTKELSPSVILILLGSAIFLGALHAFSPGHGKTIVGAYLVGSRGTARHALLLGFVVTVTHTSGVFVLGLATLFASQYIVPDQLYPWLGVISGALVAIVGLRLFFSRLQAVRTARDSQVHTHANGETHSHSDAIDHVHSHDAGDDAELAHARSHIPAALQGAPLTWQNLVSLGISGGLLPCPSALVVMLGAIALGRVALGLVLIIAFSIGLAGVLILTGLSLLYAGKIAGNLLRSDRAQNWFFRVVPIGSALVVTLLGVGLVVEALAQLGLVR